ncbi:Nif3-like dinuclear metal center hexameric protein [Phragmitibacter flavus]|uniref:GTP cyclohydrolase 1 type 2 homolog n=1 Tax=Phragmitibacter flavus TaxID=2576071 RepID=A0A5R8KKX2_9BACT|nr:Nif3-like dinuclear metal center hexameric protein [Phragmitibacter flavus]TLD72625.1 Nif3-like dinuclear metal center hexameric protein [Phragmitibacter flavus]
MQLAELTAHLDAYLSIATLPDYPPALNGLQLENTSGKVTKIGAAVDAHLPVLQKAIASGCDFLLVHHGLFWSGLQPITGAVFQKFRESMEANLAIYSAHLPLDGHLEHGNSILLAQALKLEASWSPFFPYKNFNIGVRAEVEISRDELHNRLGHALNGQVHLCAGGPEVIRNVGVITGGAGSEVAAVKALGIDTLITGEGPHWSYTLAEELGINVFYGGHYATETFGVKALAADLAQRFGLEWEFIDHPTGL